MFARPSASRVDRSWDFERGAVRMGRWETVLQTGPYLTVIGLAALWALGEILQTFRSDIRRALRSGWSGLFIGAHVLFVLALYALARRLQLLPGDPWLLAVAVGIGGPVLLRAQINLLQPLDPNVGQAVSLSLADLYGRFQRFCRDQIDQHLVSERIRLLEQAMQLPVELLEERVRLYGHASLLHSPEEIEGYLTRLRERFEGKERALYMASYLMAQVGYDFLQREIRRLQGKPQ